MSHTPKNWRVAPSITRDKLGDPIGFDVFDSNGDRVGYQLSEEDARLIAAAPDLKEALEADESLLRDIQTIITEHVCGPACLSEKYSLARIIMRMNEAEMSGTREQARDALAKCESESKP